MPEASAVSFEADEAVVLAWLLARADVQEAVDLALSGREAEAIPALKRTVEELLASEGKVAEGEKGDVVEPVAVGSTSPSGADIANPGKRSSEEVEEATTGAAGTSPKRRRGSGPARCVCVIVSGLHGCGKSALCNILREVLGGTWLNYDEFVAKQAAGRNLRQAYAAEVRGALVRGLASADQDKNQRLVLVDRVNTLRAHRGDLLQELRRLRWRSRGGRVLLVEFSHPADTYGYGTDGQIAKRFSDAHVSLCIRRISSRGPAHDTLWPSPKLRATVQAVVRSAEAASPDEMAQFDARISMEVAQSPPEMALAVVEEFRALQWFVGLRSADDLRPRIEVAWKAYQRAEQQWRAAAAEMEPEEPRNEWLAQCRRALESEKARDKARVRQADTGDDGPASVPLYWKIDLPEVSKVLEQRGILPANFTPTERPHTTLLYLGGDGSDERTAQKSNLTLEQFRAMREALEALQGEEFEVKMTEIIIEENVVCAMVSLPPIVPCANRYPHVTLGTKPGIPPRYANEVLQEAKEGRTEGITTIPLPAPRPLKGRISLEYSKGAPLATATSDIA
mmetsp:Transcript_2572/g.5955  ORF Transcript_2572/g.5955 Transcript_2572/m.5955 type:complete len:566 (-) Transcript_2572:212-1909(-)